MSIEWFYLKNSENWKTCDMSFNKNNTDEDHLRWFKMGRSDILLHREVLGTFVQFFNINIYYHPEDYMSIPDPRSLYN